jgi:hypothetical protein
MADKRCFFDCTQLRPEKKDTTKDGEKRHVYIPVAIERLVSIRFLEWMSVRQASLFDECRFLTMKKAKSCSTGEIEQTVMTDAPTK